VAQWSSNATSARERFGPISAWDVTAVTNMAYLFYGRSGFDEDINAWDVSKVTNMHKMFDGANRFNQPLGSWQVGQVTDFFEMFDHAYAMNQDISGWNVSQATDMRSMFRYASAFAACNTMALDTSACPNIAVHDSFEAQNPSRWEYTYSAKTYLSQAVAQWSSNATSARERFGPISAWDVSAVTDMARLFHGNSGFDEDINAWDVSKVTSMREMFRGASSFNQPLGSWQVGQVTNFYEMFYNADAMNQDISGWNVSQATNMGRMFIYADGLSDANKLLIRCAWAGTSAFASAGYGSSWGPGNCFSPSSPN